MDCPVAVLRTRTVSISSGEDMRMASPARSAKRFRLASWREARHNSLHDHTPKPITSRGTPRSLNGLRLTAAPSAMNSLLTSIAGQFARPVLLSALLPVIIVASLFLATTYPLLPLPLAAPDVVAKLDATWQVAYGTLLAVLFAMLLHVLNGPIARLVSGYPWKDVFPGTLLVRVRQQQFRKLQTTRDGLLKLVGTLDTSDGNPDGKAENALADRLMTALTPLARRLNEDFPYGEDLVLPTRLGNVIRNAEDYSRQQYGISAVLLWPRLLGVIDARYATLLDDAKTTFDFALNCMVLSAAAAVFTLALALTRDASGGLLDPAWWRVALFAAVSATAYAAAVNRAREWGSYIKSAVDLYRNALLKQLGYQYTLRDIADEKARVWEGIASEWTFPDMSASPIMETVPFTPAAVPIAPTEVTSADTPLLTVARGVAPPHGKPFPALTVTLRLHNPSQTGARAIAVRDTIPANWSFVWGSVAASTGTIDVTSTQPLILELNELAASTTCTITYRVQSLVAVP
jgi:uncharacterized repeat protein (TIGR01451 family)